MMSLDVYLFASDVDGNEFLAFNRNMTHNLTAMADAAGIYKALWRPEEMDPPATKAADLIPVLTAGVADLAVDRPKYLPFNPENGWGDYELLFSFSQAYLETCKRHPSARIEVSR